VVIYGFLLGIGEPSAKFAPVSQAYFALGSGFSYAPFLIYTTANSPLSPPGK